MYKKTLVPKQYNAVSVEKIVFDVLLEMITFDKGVAKTPAANLNNSGRILSKPEAVMVSFSSSNFLTFLVPVYGRKGI